MIDFAIKHYSPEYNDRLLSLTRKTYVRRKFSLSLDRGNDHCGILKAASDDYETLMAVDPETDQVYGYGDSIYYRLMLGGREHLVNYGAMGVVDPDLQKRHVGRTIFSQYVQNMLARRTDGFYIVINPQNRLMNNFVKSFPSFKDVLSWRFRLNYVLFARRYSPSRAYQYRTATREDLPKIARLLRAGLGNKILYPDWSAQALEATFDRLAGFTLDDVFVALERGRIVAVIALWDQRSLKRIKLVDCSRAGRAIRAGINLKAKLSGFAPLPHDGAFYSIYQTMFIASENDKPDPLHHLIRHVCNEKYGEEHQFVNIVLCKSDPLARALKGILRVGEDNIYHLVAFNRDMVPLIRRGRFPYLNYSFS